MKARAFHRIIILLLAAALALPAAGCREEEPEEVLWDAKPSVMIDGVLYGTTGRSAAYRTGDTPEKGAQVDGEITSTVESHEYPGEDGQSNFGSGYPYRFGQDNSVEIFFAESGKWVIYEAYDGE